MPTTTSNLGVDNQRVVTETTETFIKGLQRMGLRVTQENLTYVKGAKLDMANPIPSFMDWLDKRYQDREIPPIKVSHVNVEDGIVFFWVD